jgi:hypothetical protein
MDDHLSAGPGRSCASCWTQEVLADEALLAFDRLKRLE